MKRKSLVLLFVIVFGFFASIGLFCRTLTIGYNSDAEYEPAWSPDGSKIAFIGETYSGSHLYVMDADGSNIVQLAELGGELLGGQFPGPTWSPDGTKIAYTTDIDFWQEIWLVNLDGSGAKRLIEDETQRQSDPTWSPDGNLIAYTCNYMEVEVSSSDNICLVNVNDLTVNRLTYFSEVSSLYDLSWHADGEQIVFRKVAGDLSNSEYYRIDRDGANLTRLPFLDMQDREAVWSPDGTRIAFTKYKYDLKYDLKSDLQDEGLYMMHSDGSQVVRLTDRYVDEPSWSPDGRKLAVSVYANTMSDTHEIFVMNADGSGLRQLTGKFPIFLCDLYILTRSFC